MRSSRRDPRVAAARAQSAEKRRRSLRFAQMAVADRVLNREGGVDERTANDDGPYARVRAADAAVVRGLATFGPDDEPR